MVVVFQRFYYGCSSSRFKSSVFSYFIDLTWVDTVLFLLVITVKHMFDSMIVYRYLLAAQALLALHSCAIGSVLSSHDFSQAIV